MYLGIDLGTSGVKVILMDDQQTIITSSTARLTISRPQSLWSEQNPNDWWGATQNAIRKIKYTHANELKKVRALAFSGQMHGATLLDKNDNPLRPAILWNDGRAMAQCHTLLQRAPRALEITGNLIMPGFTAPKVLWVQENEPALFQKIKKILLPKDYLRLLISGDYATDFSDASGTSWLDVGKRQWSNALLTATGLTPELCQLYTKAQPLPALFCRLLLMFLASPKTPPLSAAAITRQALLASTLPNPARLSCPWGLPAFTLSLANVLNRILYPLFILIVTVSLIYGIK